jgi:hypothetical protein
MIDFRKSTYSGTQGGDCVDVATGERDEFEQA